MSVSSVESVDAGSSGPHSAESASDHGAMRLRNRSRGNGEPLESGGSSDSVGDRSSSSDVVTTTHTISEMHVHERSRGRRRRRGSKGGDTSIRSEKRVVVKMAVRHKSRGNASDSDDDDEADDGIDGDAEMNVCSGGNENDDRENHAISIEEIDEDDTTSDGNNATDNSNSTNHSTAAVGAADLQIAHVNDGTIQETMMRLVTETDRMKQLFQEQEQVYRRESELVEHLKKEHRALKAMAKEYKYRAREQKRVQRILRSSRKDKHLTPHSDHSRSSKHALKKQCRQLEQYQSELALRFQLLQSENNRYEMQVERQLAELRREYTDNYLFTNTSTFQ